MALLGSSAESRLRPPRAPNPTSKEHCGQRQLLRSLPASPSHVLDATHQGVELGIRILEPVGRPNAVTMFELVLYGICYVYSRLNPMLHPARSRSTILACALFSPSASTLMVAVPFRPVGLIMARARPCQVLATGWRKLATPLGF